jgi:hypothetical protein
VGGVIYTPCPRSRVRPFGSHVRPPPLQHAPVRARARSCTRPCPDTCPHRNGCAQIAFRPREDIVFAPGPTRLCPLTCVCARRVCAHNRERAKSPRPVPRVRAWSLHPFLPVRARRVCARIRGRAKSPRPVPRVRACFYQSAPGPTRPRPTRSRFYHRVHAADRAGDQCAPAVISRWRPLQPRAPPTVYKPVRTPS